MKLAIQIIVAAAILGLIGFAIYAGRKDNTKATNYSNDQKEILKIRPTDHILGNENAPVTIIEYSDFQCPFCVRLHQSLLSVVKENKNDVRWIYRHFPLPFHEYAKKAAIAVEAAGLQGKFWEYSEKLAASAQSDGTGLHEEYLKFYANSLSLNIDKFVSDWTNPMISSLVEKDIADSTSLEIEATPTFYIIDKNGEIEKFSGYYSPTDIKNLIEKAKNK